MHKCDSLVENRDLDCSSIVTQEKAKLFRPDWEEGIRHELGLRNLHAHRHQLNLWGSSQQDLEERNWEPWKWKWLPWQMDLKHPCCSATRSCLNPEGLLPEHLCLSVCFHQNTISGNQSNHSIQCNPASSILMTRFFVGP